ncbi:hypothetical protein [Metamycoplasma alkalescens]|uniref:Uncharacterized protein n=3 Tax=Metamycoplasma alkalescens TaxID=45363 RepID=A0A318UJF3_9BACT|nr:hypothetical protein [Metamycoplasma alkalescens]PYF43144.1 hypothetical protein BCF88_1049 [Metamycoplasma alkalescens]
MKITRIGKNHHLVIKNVDYLSPELQTYNNIKLTKFLDSSKDLELLISDNLSFEELGGIIAGMHGLQGGNYYAFFELELFNLEKNQNQLNQNLDFLSKISKDTVINNDSYLYHYKKYFGNQTNKNYLTLVLADRGLVSFEFFFKQTPFQASSKNYDDLKDNLLNKKLANFSLNFDKNKMFQNARDSFWLGNKLVLKLLENNFAFFEFEYEKPEFIKITNSHDAYEELFTRIELATISPEMLSIFEWRLNINEIRYESEEYIEDSKTSDDNQSKNKEEKDSSQEKNYWKNNVFFNFDSLTEEEKIMLQNLPKEEIEKIFNQNNFDPESFEKIKENFLNQFITMLNDLKLSDDKVKELLEEFVDEFKKNSIPGMNNFQISDSEKEIFLTEVFEMYKNYKNNKSFRDAGNQESNNFNDDDIN